MPSKENKQQYMSKKHLVKSDKIEKEYQEYR